MKIFYTLAWSLLLCLYACSPDNKPKVNTLEKDEHQTIEQHIDQDNTIHSRINPPQDYVRVELDTFSFQHYLRSLPLKPVGSSVHYYNGSQKANQGVYTSVVDLPIGNKDLHQCADAVMRLKAEYHWHKQEYDQIHFNFTNGYRVDYVEWMTGRRMVVDGNKTFWDDGSNGSNTYEDFWDYMELIFMYAGTASLEQELKIVNIEDADIGDVLIQGGHPGHAVIIVDMANHKETNQPVFLLAQSYMPAQELQILVNPRNSRLSPWYTFENEQIQTPEWLFSTKDLRRFRD